MICVEHLADCFFLVMQDVIIYCRFILGEYDPTFPHSGELSVHSIGENVL